MASTILDAPDVRATPDEGMRFGHPRGLSTLFFTEVWERFSYYGMRALLVLFMTAAASGTNAGLGMDVKTSTAIYGLYTSLVYLLALPGGWVADSCGVSNARSSSVAASSRAGTSPSPPR